MYGYVRSTSTNVKRADFYNGSRLTGPTAMVRPRRRKIQKITPSVLRTISSHCRWIRASAPDTKTPLVAGMSAHRPGASKGLRVSFLCYITRARSRDGHSPVNDGRLAI